MDSDKLYKPIIKGRINYSLYAGHNSACISHPYSPMKLKGKQQDENKVEYGLTAPLSNE